MAWRLVSLLAIIAVGLSGGCVTAKEKMEMRYESGLRPFTPYGLQQAGLDTVWEVDLSMLGEKETDVRVTKVYLYPETILIETEKYNIYSFDRATGQPQWVTLMTGPLAVKPTLFDRRYYTICNGYLTTIDPRGTVEIGTAFPYSASAQLVVTQEHYYVAAGVHGLHKLDRKKLLDIWPAPARSSGVILGAPVRLEDLVLFSTSEGEVIGVDFITGGRRVSLKMEGGIYSGLAEDGANFYFGANDFYVYSYSVLGTPNWRTLIQGRAASTPMPAGDAIYIDTLGEGVWALDRDTGAYRWDNPKLEAFVSGAENQAFCIAQMNELWVVDLATGEPTERVDVQEFSFAPKNTSGDAMVYLVSAKGRIVCLKVQ